MYVKKTNTCNFKLQIKTFLKDVYWPVMDNNYPLAANKHLCDFCDPVWVKCHMSRHCIFIFLVYHSDCYQFDKNSSYNITAADIMRCLI